jgi:hypothetical protein
MLLLSFVYIAAMIVLAEVVGAGQSLYDGH